MLNQTQPIGITEIDSASGGLQRGFMVEKIRNWKQNHTMNSLEVFKSSELNQENLDKTLTIRTTEI